MRSKAFLTVLLLAGCGAGFFVWNMTRARATATVLPASYLPNWDAAKAATYLDSREIYWQSWTPAQRDKGTICISCHTVLPYAMARPALRTAASETSTSAPERILIESVEKRVGYWAQMLPVYSEQVGPGKAAQSRATEAVLNAIILASYDTRQGHLRPIARTAFDEAWALQETTGGWKWQDFNLAPWESGESAYQGAALFAVKVENAPDGYAMEPYVLPYVDRLWDYLQRGYSSQPVMNQLYVLWASAKSPRPLSLEQRKILLDELRSLQQRDGGWSLPSLVIAPNLSQWQRVRKHLEIALQSPQSDGCATGLVVLVLEDREQAARTQP